MNLPGWLLRRLGIVSPTGRHLTRHQRRERDEQWHAFTESLNKAARRVEGITVHSYVVSCEHCDTVFTARDADDRQARQRAREWEHQHAERHGVEQPEAPVIEG
jgi:hypothetical protein